jgi:hypothetical protein
MGQVMTGEGGRNGLLDRMPTGWFAHATELVQGLIERTVMFSSAGVVRMRREAVLPALGGRHKMLPTIGQLWRDVHPPPTTRTCGSTLPAGDHLGVK